MRVDAETIAKEFYEARNPSMRWSALAWWEKMHMAVLAEREACAAVCDAITWSEEGKFFAQAIRRRNERS